MSFKKIIPTVRKTDLLVNSFLAGVGITTGALTSINVLDVVTKIILNTQK
tara:strand:+ start:1714 stop:1863 length:150 start_codon:yes stop_codon:yes gene_type:complete